MWIIQINGENYQCLLFIMVTSYVHYQDIIPLNTNGGKPQIASCKQSDQYMKGSSRLLYYILPIVQESPQTACPPLGTNR